MGYSIEPRDRTYVKGYGFLSFAKNICENVSGGVVKKLLDSAKKSTTDAISTVSKRAIQKTAEATGNNRSISKKSTKELHSQNEDELEIPKKRHISPEKRQ